MFLVLALLAALVELHSGTFYLAALSLVSLATFALGFVLHEDFLILAFLAMSAAGLAAVWVARRRLRGRDRVGDFDLGQTVLVLGAAGPDGIIAVQYRGTQWMAEMEDGQAPLPGLPASIVGRRGNVLRLVAAEQRETT
ncbi:MAG: hypothetical protein KGL12_15910 [Rhodospirillales bacterium]|nr:hypothetical protein [Rhodospirillales bacterium]